MPPSSKYFPGMAYLLSPCVCDVWSAINVFHWVEDISFNDCYPMNIPPRYNWNIVESGVKHHNLPMNIAVLVGFVIWLPFIFLFFWSFTQYCLCLLVVHSWLLLHFSFNVYYMQWLNDNKILYIFGGFIKIVC